MNKIDELKQNYEAVCNSYIELFSKKQVIDFDYWVSDEIGGIAVFGDFYLNFSDIVWDVNSEQPPRSIVNWYWENMDCLEKSINYYSYTLGLRIADLRN